MKRLKLTASAFLIILFSCTQVTTTEKPVAQNSWQQQFDEQLALNGHRNWVLVVDKAFPQQPGMHIINTNEKLLPVLETVLHKIKNSSHVKPIVYNDAELQYITDSLAAGADAYKVSLQKSLNGIAAQPILHDSVFVKMDKASKLFSITVLKTEEVIPYSSVFIELDCAYWGGDKESTLRQIMRGSKQ
jgi:hypothetical protein